MVLERESVQQGHAPGRAGSSRPENLKPVHATEHAEGALQAAQTAGSPPGQLQGQVDRHADSLFMKELLPTLG